MGARKSKAETLAGEREAVNLRLAGWTYERISEVVTWTDGEGTKRQLYSNASGARRAVTRALTAQVTESAGELKHRELARIDAAMKAIWPKVIQGHVSSIDRMISLQNQLGKLVEGFQVPTRVAAEHTGGEGGAVPFAVSFMLPPKGSDMPYPFPTEEEPNGPQAATRP